MAETAKGATVDCDPVLMNKVIWIVSELYYPETTSTGYILTQIAEGLTDYFSVNVICGQPSYSARGTKAPTREFHHNVNIYRSWATTLDKDVLLLRMVNLLTVTVSLFFSTLLRIRRGHLVLVVTNPPALPFAVIMACRMRGAHCALLIHDIYPDLAVAAGTLKANSLATKLLNWLNSRLYNSMECIFVLGRDMQEKVTERLSGNKERVVVATNWADLDLVVPQQRYSNALLQELGLADKFVIQYAGNMGYPNDIECIVEAAALLKQEEDIHFLFIGSGAKMSLVQNALEKHSLSNITILSHRPRSNQSIFLNACDVALIALVHGMKGVSVPSRTYNTLAAGKPIIAIAEKGSELALVINEDKVGWRVEPGQPEQLVAAILDAKSEPERLQQMGSCARRTAVSKYSMNHVLNNFYRALSSIK